MTTSATYVLFTIDEIRCAVRASSVVEVLPFPALFRPPGTPRVVAGFLDLAGKAVAVLEMAVLLDPGAARKPLRDRADQHLLLLKIESTATQIAFAVDRVLDIATIRMMEAAPEAESRLPREVSSLCFWHDDTIVHLVSVDGLLKLEEQVRLADLAEQAQARAAAWEDAQ